MMTRLSAFALLALVTASAAIAQPELVVTYEGVNSSGNNTWAVLIGPDPLLFTNTTSGFGSSLGTELAFAIVGSELVSVSQNALDWDTEIPGDNPFTNSVTEGIWRSIDQTQMFTSIGSRVFLDAGPYETLYIETLGSNTTTINYGTAASGNSYGGTLIAQSAIIFAGYTGSVTSTAIPEPATCVLAVGLLAGLFVIRRAQTA